MYRIYKSDYCRSRDVWITEVLINSSIHIIYHAITAYIVPIIYRGVAEDVASATAAMLETSYLKTNEF